MDQLSRKPSPWEDLLSWMISIPGNAIPKEMYNDDGSINKTAAVNEMSNYLAGMNDSITNPSWRTDNDKMTVACVEELPILKSKLCMHDFNSKMESHLHFLCKYEGRQCKTSHMWEDNLKSMGVPCVDVSTFEPVS